MKRIILLLITIAFVFGCTNDEQLKLTQNIGNDISETEALDILQKMLSNQPQTRNGIKNISVKAKSYYSVDNVKYPMYHFLIEGDEQGFALVSADKRCPEIICYVPNGQLSDTIFNCAANTMLKMAEKSIAEEIRLNGARRRDGDSLILISEVTPLLETTWDQTYPYNAQNEETACSLFANSTYQWKYPVGCHAVAVAQLFGYYEKSLGFTINWLDLKELPSISASETAKANLISNYMKLIAINLDMEYDCSGGGTTINKVMTYLANNGLSLTNETSTRFNTTSLSWLDNGNIVYLRGKENNSIGEEIGRHAWLIDGYQKYKYQSSNSYKYYLHTNYGWGGRFDGYYAISNNTTMVLPLHATDQNYYLNNITYYKVEEIY